MIHAYRYPAKPEVPRDLDIELPLFEIAQIHVGDFKLPRAAKAESKRQYRSPDCRKNTAQ